MDNGKPANVAHSTEAGGNGETAKTQTPPPATDAAPETKKAVSVAPPIRKTITATAKKPESTAKDEKSVDRPLEDTTTVFTLFLSHSGGDSGDTDTVVSVISFHGGDSNTQEQDVNDAQDFKAIFGGAGLFLQRFGRNTFTDPAPARCEVYLPATLFSHPLRILDFDFNWPVLDPALSAKDTSWSQEWHNTGDQNWRATVEWTVFDPRV
jgi:hypothetical protein